MNEIRVIQRLNPVPGIDLLEYIVNDELKEITINIDYVEVKNIEYDQYEQLLSELTEVNPANLPEILNRKCLKIFKKNISELSKKSRNREEYVLPRQIACYWAKNNSKASLGFIGSIFDQDHANILNSVRKIDGFLTYDKKIISLYIQFCNA